MRLLTARTVTATYIVASNGMIDVIRFGHCARIDSCCVKLRMATEPKP